MEDFWNRTFVTVKWKCFSKPLLIEINWTNQIASFDQHLKRLQYHPSNICCVGDTAFTVIQLFSFVFLSTVISPHYWNHRNSADTFSKLRLLSTFFDINLWGLCEWTPWFSVRMIGSASALPAHNLTTDLHRRGNASTLSLHFASCLALHNLMKFPGLMSVKFAHRENDFFHFYQQGVPLYFCPNNVSSKDPNN